MAAHSGVQKVLHGVIRKAENNRSKPNQHLHCVGNTIAWHIVCLRFCLLIANNTAAGALHFDVAGTTNSLQKTAQQHSEETGNRLLTEAWQYTFRSDRLLQTFY